MCRFAALLKEIVINLDKNFFWGEEFIIICRNFFQFHRQRRYAELLHIFPYE